MSPAGCFFCTLGAVFVLNAATAASSNMTGLTDSSFVNVTVIINSTIAGAPANETINSTTAGPTTPARVTEPPQSTQSTRGPPVIYTPKPATRVPIIAKTTMIPIKPAPNVEDNRTGIIILIVMLAAVFLVGVACCITKHRGKKRYSINVLAAPDQVDIPLSNMEQEPLTEVASQNGLSTFQSPGPRQEEPPESEQEVKQDQKAEADKSVDAAPPAETTEDKPALEPAEQSVTAPVEPEKEGKTDEQVPDKTSDEAVKEKTETTATEETPLGEAEQGTSLAFEASV